MPHLNPPQGEDFPNSQVIRTRGKLRPVCYMRGLKILCCLTVTAMSPAVMDLLNIK
jgi:hypothetical protein